MVSTVWLSGNGQGVYESASQLQARGFAIALEPETNVHAKDRAAGFVSGGVAQVPNAVVFFAPRAADDLRAGDIAAHVARVVADFAMLVKSAVTTMARERRSGAIVAVCDIAGIPGRSGYSADAALSGALIGACKCLAKELGRQNISVNVVCYGVLPELGAQDNLNKAERKLFDMMQLGKSGKLEHIVDNISHLIRNGHLMTGQVLHVDDGLIM